MRPAFTYLSAGPRDAVWATALASPWVETVGADEATHFIARSAFLEAGRGYLPHGWQFYPFGRAPEVYLAQMRHLFGIRRDGRLRGLMCLGAPTHGEGELAIDFLEGDLETSQLLLRHALHSAAGAANVALMLPRDGEKTFCSARRGPAAGDPLLERLLRRRLRVRDRSRAAPGEGRRWVTSAGCWGWTSGRRAPSAPWCGHQTAARSRSRAQPIDPRRHAPAGPSRIPGCGKRQQPSASARRWPERGKSIRAAPRPR